MALSLFCLFRVSQSADGKTISFGLQLNGTVKERRGVWEDLDFTCCVVPLQVQVEREIMRYLSAQATGAASASAIALNWDIGYRQFAHPAITPFSAVGSFAGTPSRAKHTLLARFPRFSHLSSRSMPC